MQTPRLIGIHGLANKPPAEEKARWWRCAVEEGIRRNLGTERPAFEFTFVYWADLRYPTPLDDDGNREPYRPDEGLGPFPEPEPERKGDDLSLVDRLYRSIDWMQEKTGLTPVDDAILEYRLDDLWGYYADRDFRDAVRARLRAVIERLPEGPVLLAAHSMGSLIAYDTLRLMERDGAGRPIAHLVSMGSPLGLSEIKLKIEAEHGDLAVPAGLERWTNLVDRQDIATVGDDLCDIYAANAAGVGAQDVAVENAYRRPDGSRNRHKSYGYLRTPPFSRAVAAHVGAHAEAEAARPAERAAE